MIMTAYLIANYDVNNQERYQDYLAAAVPLIAEHGGKILVAGPDSEDCGGRPACNDGCGQISNHGEAA